MVRHQERRARQRHDLVGARALRVHLTARDALEIRERGLAVRAGVEPCERHAGLLPASSGSPDDELRAASDAERRPLAPCDDAFRVAALAAWKIWVDDRAELSRSRQARVSSTVVRTITV